MKAQSHYGCCDSFGAIWGMGMLNSGICSSLVPVCAMKGVPIGPLAQSGKDLIYYLTPFSCLVNWDMYCPGSTCRGTDLPPGSILYIHKMAKWYLGNHVSLTLPGICLIGTENPRKTSPRKLVQTGDRTRTHYVTGAHATACSTAVDKA